MSRLILIMVCLFTAVSTQAGSFKCGTKLVQPGDGKVVVLDRCGEPLFKEVISGEDQFKVEQWTYKARGYRSFVRILTFQGGRLSRIEIGERLD